MRIPLQLLLLITLLAACGGNGEADVPETDDTADVEDADVDAATDAEDAPDSDDIADDSSDSVDAATILATQVNVTLDGVPTEGIWVTQAGNPAVHTHTDKNGSATLLLDLTIVGDITIAASHPEARLGGALLYLDFLEPEYLIELKRFSLDDNEDFIFDPAGEPGKAPNTEYCGHCHTTILEEWFNSEHRKSASNVAVQDLYAGVAGSLVGEAACTDAGGLWQLGIKPGTSDAAFRCYLGDGVLPALNPGCDSDGACDGKGENFGACADCHAPTINGKLGGRDLLEATGDVYKWGVRCDACHRVESIDLDAEPGVAGRLRIVRPSEPSSSPSLGKFAPLAFGPSHDSMNVRMGSVQRDHFHKATLCAGCHEQEQAVLVPGAVIDTTRWPSGRLPIHSTYSEWKNGPMNPAAPCQSCHMPPNPLLSNSADQQSNPVAPVGWVAGWIRPAGTVNKHTWDGPRAGKSGMLQAAAALFVTQSVSDGVLSVQVKTKNVGPGHAIPTGEPMRSLLLTVAARCGDQPLKATGGDTVPGFGGYLARQSKSDDWSQWPGAGVGDVVRVVTQPGGWHNYEGFGPFGDGSFNAEQKGMRQNHYAGESTIVSVAGAAVTFDTPLPDGDLAYRVGPEARAGEPGFGFARVLTGKDGQEMVPHFMAVDVKSDNRLLPQKSYLSSHTFASSCETPVVEARLYHRAYPFDLAKQRGWPLKETLMTEVVK